MADNYINSLGVYKAKLKRVFERDAKGQSKPAAYAEFERLSDGAICSMRFSSPMTDSDYFRASKLIKELTGKYIKIDQLKAKGQKVVVKYMNDSLSSQPASIYVRPHEWEYQPGKIKTIYGIEDVIHPKFELDEPLKGDPFADDFAGSSNLQEQAAAANHAGSDGDNDIPF